MKRDGRFSMRCGVRLGVLAFCLSISSIVANESPTLEEATKAFGAGNYNVAKDIYTRLCNTVKPDNKESSKTGAKACSGLAYMYQSGKGVKVDLKMSSSLYDKACKAGDTQSCNKVGW